MASPQLQTRVDPEVAERVEQYQDDAEDPITKAEAVRRLVHDGLEANGYTDDHAADGGDGSFLDRLGPGPLGDITTPFELFTSKVYGVATVLALLTVLYGVGLLAILEGLGPFALGTMLLLGGPLAFLALGTFLTVGLAALCELALATNLTGDGTPDTLIWGPRGGNR